MVTITGTLRNLDGTPYKGAIVEAYLNSQMNYDGSIYGNEIFRTVSNIYGKFELDLVPSTVDSTRENYYVFKIVKETTNTYRKVVPSTNLSMDFENLLDFIPQNKRVKLIGNANHGLNPNPIILPPELIGMFVWQAVEANGTQVNFTVSGEVYIVAVNGVLVSPSIDYVKTAPNSIEFYAPPLNGDLVSIQYRL